MHDDGLTCNVCAAATREWLLPIDEWFDMTVAAVRERHGLRYPLPLRVRGGVCAACAAGVRQLEKYAKNIVAIREYAKTLETERG